MRPTLALLLALAACTPPAISQVPAAPLAAATGFDAQAWLARASAQSGDVSDLADPRLAQIRALTAELDAATGWDRACDSFWNPEAQQMTVVENSAGYLRGIYFVHAIRPGEAVVAVQCDYGAHSGREAFVHIVGRQAALLLGQSVETDGTPFGPPTAVYDTHSTFTPDGFEIFSPASLGSCGTVELYQIVSLGRARLVEASGQACGGDGAPSDEWPVVYPRP